MSTEVHTATPAFEAMADPAAKVTGPTKSARVVGEFPKGIDVTAFRKAYVEAQELRQSVLDHESWWKNLVEFAPDTNIEQYTKYIADKYKHDFGVAWSFWPEFVAQLTYSGWLVTAQATDAEADGTFRLEWPLPKLHQKRCLLTDWSKLSVHGSTVKRARKYYLSFNLDPEASVQHCVEQHGDSWLYPRLRAAYLAMLRSNASRSTAHIWTAELWREASPEELAEQQALAAELKAAGKTHPDAPVFAKPEYVDEDDIRRKVVVPGQRSIVKSLALPGYVMVAGDLGCSVGGSYCSMTGWRDLSEDGAGTVLLAALGRHLAARGFDFWDFGMTMKYKEELGAKPVPRLAFLKQLAATRDRTGLWLGFTDGAAHRASDVIASGVAVVAAAEDAGAAAGAALDKIVATKLGGAAASESKKTSVDTAAAASAAAAPAAAAADAAGTAAGGGAISKSQQKRDAKRASKAQFAALSAEEKAVALAAKHAAEAAAKARLAPAAAAAGGVK